MHHDKRGVICYGDPHRASQARSTPSKVIPMTEIDKALETLRANPEDHKAQSGFYDLFLNSGFFVPTVTETFINGSGENEEASVPLLVESDGTDFLVFFDQQQRLDAWAEQEAPSIQVPGHMLAEMSTEKIHWVMNMGTDFTKEFVPEEIAWLKDVVTRCKAEDEAAAE